MKSFFTFLTTCFMLSFAAAQTPPQPAPDFTITTSDGVQRHLYADYLDQGKSVVLLLFFTTCPICTDLAPLMEPFYYEWGNGHGSAEFISLSIIANDSNDDVKRYKAMLGHSFLGAGSDGGSLVAAQPYTSGSYGFFAGSPTFVVIAPDKTVTYNPKGSSFAATIDSVDQALRRTGIEKPAVPFNLKGSILAPDSIPVANIHIGVRNVESNESFTDTLGKFKLSASLIARSTYSLHLENNEDYSNVVTTFDVVKVQRHVLGLEVFTSPYQLLAADVDRSGTITALDIIQMRKIVLHVDIKFAKSNSWLFLNKKYQFLDPEDPFFEAYTGEAASFVFKPTRKEVDPFSIIAIKIGDVNFSAR